MLGDRVPEVLELRVECVSDPASVFLGRLLSSAWLTSGAVYMLESRFRASGRHSRRLR